MRRRTIGIIVVVITMVLAGVIAIANATTTSTNIAGGDTLSAHCNGSSMDMRPQGKLDVDLKCNPVTTLPPTTTVPPTTVPPTTVPPTTTPPTTTTSPPVSGHTYFSNASLWNTPIPANATFHDKAALRSSQWWINFGEYSNPVYKGSSSDPVVTVHAQNSWGWPDATLSVHVPASTNPASGTDESVVIINGTTAYDFWLFRWNNAAHTDASASAYGESDIVTGTGFGTYSPWLGAGIRAAGSSGLGGEIVGSELRTGINHALAVAGIGGMFCAEAGPNGFIAPAINADGACEGPRVGIPQGVAMPAGLSVSGQNVWKALQKYGGFAVDTVGGSSPVIINADPVSVPGTDIAPLYNDLAIITPYVRMVN